MTGSKAPDDVRELARARAAARSGHDWAEADRLRASIEAAGWAVVDRGTHFELNALHPPDRSDGDFVRHGSSDSVPSRLAGPATHLATIVIVAGDWPGDLTRALAGLRATSPSGTQVIVVADAPSADLEASLLGVTLDLHGAIGDLPPETVWTSARLGRAGATNAGLRRAAGGVVILVETNVEAIGDIVSPLVQALEDRSVAVTGPWGLTSSDLRSFAESAPGDVDVIAGSCLAFRRDDVLERGPLDEHFQVRRDLDAWWSLVLRDEGEGSRPRRAVGLGRLPVVRHDERGEPGLSPAERERLGRRNHYRLLDRFRTRPDLLAGPAQRPSVATSGPASVARDPTAAG